MYQLYIYIYSPPRPFGFPFHLGNHTHWLEFPVLYSRFSSVTCFICSINSLDMSIPVSQFIASFSLGIHTFVLYVSVSISALQRRLSVWFFSISHTCINMWYLFFSFWLTSLCMTNSRSSHISANGTISSFLWHSNISLCICTTYFFIHSSADWHSLIGCFQVLPIVNMNLHWFLIEIQDYRICILLSLYCIHSSLISYPKP